MGELKNQIDELVKENRQSYFLFGFSAGVIFMFIVYLIVLLFT